MSNNSCRRRVPQKMPPPPTHDAKGNETVHAVVEDRDNPGELLYLHRLVWTNAHGDIPHGYDVRHKNGDTLDNRRKNLELYKLPSKDINE